MGFYQGRTTAPVRLRHGGCFRWCIKNRRSCRSQHVLKNQFELTCSDCKDMSSRSQSICNLKYVITGFLKIGILDTGGLLVVRIDLCCRDVSAVRIRQLQGSLLIWNQYNHLDSGQDGKCEAYDHVGFRWPGSWSTLWIFDETKFLSDCYITGWRTFW